MTQKRYLIITIAAFIIVAVIALLEAPPFFYNNYYLQNSQNFKINNSEKININTAVKAQLMLLDDIGEVKALAIIEYRNAFGKFNSIEEIKKVKGVSEKIFKKIKNEIEV